MTIEDDVRRYREWVGKTYYGDDAWASKAPDPDDFMVHPSLRSAEGLDSDDAKLQALCPSLAAFYGKVHVAGAELLGVHLQDAASAFGLAPVSWTVG